MKKMIPVAALLLLLLAMGVYALTVPKEFSETERRTLSAYPTDLLSATAMEDINTAMVDHIPLRDFFAGLHSYFQTFTGRTMTNSALLAGNAAVNPPAEVDFSGLEKRMSKLNALADTLSIPAYLLPVPQAGASAALPGYLKAFYRDQEIYPKIRALSTLKVVDVSALLSLEETFYRTDHHWNQRGACIAADALLKAMEKPALNPAGFTAVDAGSLYGSTRASGAYFLMQPDMLTLYDNHKPVTVTCDDGTVRGSLFFTEYADTWDSYRVFLGENRGLTIIESPEADSGETLLVIKDSYFNSLSPFLTGAFSKMVVVDLRYYNGSLTELAAQEKADRLLVLYSVDGLMNDLNLARIRE